MNVMTPSDSTHRESEREEEEEDEEEVPHWDPKPVHSRTPERLKQTEAALTSQVQTL